MISLRRIGIVNAGRHLTQKTMTLSQRALLLFLSLALAVVYGAQASEPSIGFAVGAHDGSIRLLHREDLTRKITSTTTVTYQTKGANGGPVFEISFADVDQATGFGFDDPARGATRRATVIAAFQHISSTLPTHSGTARVRLELSLNDANFFSAAQAFPFFPGHPCEEGFVTPLMYRAIVRNEHVGDFDGSIVVNFLNSFDFNDDHNESPGANQIDLFSLMLHEAVHTLGFLGFAYDDTGHPRFLCDPLFVLPNYLQAARNENDQPLWEEVNGVPRFVGDLDLDVNPASFHYVQLDGFDRDATRLDRSQFLQDGELFQIYSGHWHRDVGVLMSPNMPANGTRFSALSPQTQKFLDDAVGYAKGGEASLFGLTGSWFDPDSSGRGFNLQMVTEDRFLIFFYGYLDSGERLWLIGDYTGPIALNTDIQVNMLEANGGSFGDFDPDGVSVTDWGTLQLNFRDCDNGQASLVGAPGMEALSLVKLASVSALSCSGGSAVR